MTDRTLDHFQSNPDDVANISEAEALALAAEMGGVPVPAPETEVKVDDAAAPAAAAEVAAKPEPAKAAEPAAAKPDDPKPVVLAPDGKSTIPYAVLASERNRASAAERAVAEQAATINTLSERLAALEANGGKPAEPAKDEIREQIEALREEAPDVAAAMEKIYDGVMAKLAVVDTKASEIEKSQQETQEEVMARLNTDVQKAIDSNPALVHWRENSPELYEEAKAFDGVLRGQAAWAEKPFSERFDQVVKLVVAAHEGESVLPATSSTPAPAVPAAKATAAQIQQAAEAKLRSAVPPVVTLTDIPGGKPTEQNETERADTMTVAQLGAMFEKMSPDQQSAYLASM